MWDKRAKFLGNHDGDNATMVLDQGFGDTKTLEIRLLGTFAPELVDVGGPQTQQFVNDWFYARTRPNVTWNFVVTTVRMKTVDREQKSFDRWIGIISDINNQSVLNVDVMEFVLKNGYAGGIGAK